MIISILIVTGLIFIPGVSNFLQAHRYQIIGPIFLLTGLFILELVPLRLPNVSFKV